MKIKLLNKTPDDAQVVMLDKSLLDKVSCIMVDDVALVFSGRAAAEVEPETVHCTLKPAKPKKASRSKPVRDKKLVPMDLLEMRQKAGVGLNAFGHSLGIDGGTLSSIETGKSIRKTTVKKIEKKLKRKLDEEKFTHPEPLSKSEKKRIKEIRDKLSRAALAEAVSQSWEHR
jgi:DNA-binding transcriptional regulator YiaG